MEYIYYLSGKYSVNFDQYEDEFGRTVEVELPDGTNIRKTSRDNELSYEQLGRGIIEDMLSMYVNDHS